MNLDPEQFSDVFTDEERRTWERVPVAIFGRCQLANKLEIPCQAVSISPGDISVIAAHMPTMSEKIIIYLDHVGRLEGNVIRFIENGFATSITATPRKREKLAARIEWLKARQEFGTRDDRRHERIIPRNTNSEIRLDDGRTYPIKIIDISLSGAAIESDVRPAMGSAISLGGMQGRVVRHFEEGIAIEFAALQAANNLAGQSVV